MDISKETWEALIREVKEAGDYAAEKQKSVVRNFKPDGSVLTEIDTKLDARLTSKIEELFPGCRIVSEENPADLKESSDWTFTIDPIDGTDSFSQSMPGWCVAVGILDRDMEPSGAVIYAPAWGPAGGTLATLAPGGDLYLNGKKYFPEIDKGKEHPFQIMAGSKIHRHFEYRSFKWKIRTTGSGVLNIMGQVIHNAVEGALLTPCYIWDMAAAHAVIKKAGFSLQYLSGKKIDYGYLARRNKAEDYLVAGTETTIKTIKNNFLLLKQLKNPEKLI